MPSYSILGIPELRMKVLSDISASHGKSHAEATVAGSHGHDRQRQTDSMCLPDPQVRSLAVCVVTPRERGNAPKRGRHSTICLFFRQAHLRGGSLMV